ncbi:MAG: OsmC family protein [Gammaproteobacteria bacterium]|nr:OsmC family protein [Gammaproteobacteria bacterium]
MQDLPHHYAVTASAGTEGNVALDSPGLEGIASAGPAEFGGPGNLWSPETLLVAAVADCFILSFRAIARASRFEWTSLDCDVVGELDRVDKVTRFTDFRVRAKLAIPAGVSEDKARRLLEKAEHSCLVTNSMSARVHLEAEIEVAGMPA